MTRVQTNGLQVAPVLHDFIEREAIAGTGLSSAAFWEGLAGLVRDFAPRDRELLAVRDKIQGQIDEYHRGLAGKAFRPGRVRAVPARDRLCAARAGGFFGPDAARGRRDRPHRRSAARGAGVECPLCAQCRQCPLGQPLRRALRHRRHLRGRTAPAAAAATTRRAAPRWWRVPAPFWTRPRPLAGGSHADAASYAVAGRHARRSRFEDGTETGLERSGAASSAIRAMRATPVRRAPAPQRPASSRSGIDRSQPDRRGRSGRHRRRRARIGRLDHHGPGGLASRRWMRTTRSRSTATGSA